MVDLQVLSSLDQLLFILKILLKTSYLYEEVNCTEPSPLVSVLCFKSNIFREAMSLYTFGASIG
jgi:hypothetical protein